MIIITESVIGKDLDYIQKTLECSDTQEARNQFEEICVYASELLMDSKYSNNMPLEIRWAISALMIYGDTFIDWVDMSLCDNDNDNDDKNENENSNNS